MVTPNWKCGHSKTIAERCMECELVSAREALSFAQQDVEKYSAKIARLEAEQCAGISAECGNP